MLSPDELIKIETRLKDGESPAQIAKSLGKSRSWLIMSLLEHGKKIGTTRFFVDVREGKRDTAAAA